MQLLQRHRLGDGNRKRRVSVDVLAEQYALGPGLGGEVALPPLHRDLPRRRLARRTGLRPDHLDREKVARDKQRFLGDRVEGEGFEGNFYGGFHGGFSCCYEIGIGVK